MPRETLLKLVQWMFLMLGLAFLFVLFRSLSGPPLTVDTGHPFDDVETGETALRRINGDRVWATRLSALQRSQAIELANVVMDPNSGCKAVVAVCALHAETQQNGIEIAFSLKAPPQLSRQTPWYGGFIDPTTGAVYDRLGRAYRLNDNTAPNALPIATTIMD
ncbi:hypothetical protein GCM10008090_31660 [Arenicella chitinivorans]|uniref:Uncharacterized protein n=1 Tax=Arenicella chitinivorans TaxID=1329800 RepID=A0A918VQJ5_9GAMM|nr:hypothetical protein [Arenicella chitinivorans]GHA19633.1 hypothetical protein GCM10008090_31660 [Arenicella chitinivorans]